MKVSTSGNTDIAARLSSPSGRSIAARSSTRWCSERNIHLGRCFDLTDTWATSQLSYYHDLLRRDLEERGERLPKNRPAAEGDFDLVLRDLDRAVHSFTLRTFDDQIHEGVYIIRTKKLAAALWRESRR